MKSTLFCLSLLLLIGCATPYKSDGLMGGFSDYQLAEDVFCVEFRGNAYTSAARVQQYCLRRAAEVSLAHDYSWFAIVTEKEWRDHVSVQMPSTSYTSGQSTHYGNTVQFSSQTLSIPGQAIPLNFPHARIVVQCWRDKPAHFVMDAHILAAPQSGRITSIANQATASH